MPLKILYPELQLTLLESTRKKTRFLEAVVTQLGLIGVTILSERVEQLGQDKAHREQYDWAVARGVAHMPVLAEYLLPLCQIQGHMLAQKGANAIAETTLAMSAVTKLGGGTPSFYPIDLPDMEQSHYLVVVDKVQATPLQYPRRVGVPSKRPLS